MLFVTLFSILRAKNFFEIAELQIVPSMSKEGNSEGPHRAVIFPDGGGQYGWQ